LKVADPGGGPAALPAASAAKAAVRPVDPELYRRLLETAPDAIVVIDAAGRIVFVNQQTERMFEYANDELIGQPIELLMPERLHAGHRAHREHYTRAPSVRPMGAGMTLTAITRSGREFPVEISLSPVRVQEASFVSAAIRDVTRLQSAREAMTRAHYHAHVAALGQQVIAARDLDEIAAAVPGVAARALSADVVILYLLNAAETEFVCRAAYGVPAEAYADLRARNQPSTGPGFVAAAGDTVTVEDYRTETRFDPGPSIATLGLVSAMGVPIMGERSPVGVITARFRNRRKFSADDRNFLRSVANIVGAAIKYSQAEERLRHAQQLEAVGQLTGGIAHDFNNLLTVIMGNLQIVQEDAAPDESIAQPVDAALRAATSAADLTRKLLAFSRRQALRPRSVDVNELVGSMLDMIRRSLGERITIIAHPGSSVPPAHADPAQLETALLNLVVNARDAMPHGGRLSIETGTRTFDSEYALQAGDVDPGRYVMIAVSDNGSGMPREVLARAFDPYFTTKERGKGSGLGLSMVHGFVKQSRGHVAIYSEPGHGTTVRLFLPVAQGAQAGPHRGEADAVPGGRETILMVEDEQAVREVGARFLAQLGYVVHQAGDVETALQLLAAHPEIRLVFTDIVLPGSRGGIELAADVRRLRPDIALLFTSGYASGAVDGLENLPGRLLDKPYQRKTLALAVRAAIDGKR
jgi:PAS domain S-box-containing protein